MALVQYDSVTTFEMTVNCGYFVMYVCISVFCNHCRHLGGGGGGGFMCRPGVGNKILGGIPGMSQGGGGGMLNQKIEGHKGKPV